MSQAFEHLFSPIELGPITVKNRIYITPHATMFVSDNRDNLPGDRLSYYCAERAKGGVGLIEVSMARVVAGVGETSLLTDSHFSPLSLGHPMDLTGRFPIRASDPRVVEGYSKLARHVHEYGAKCFIELSSAVASGMAVSSYPVPLIRSTRCLSQKGKWMRRPSKLKLKPLEGGRNSLEIQGWTE